VYLAFNKSNRDTLYLGEAQGLYCLINIGDNNSDGKDEIAIVVDLLDYSRVNICRIYTLCNNKWIVLKQFTINEDAFNDLTGDKASIFNEIRGYLEKQKGKWHYRDLLEDKEKMEPLILKQCVYKNTHEQRRF
jgi:hypothetical protein